MYWYPGEDWDRAKLACGQMKRMYGLRENDCAPGFSRLTANKPGIYTFRGSHDGPVTVYLNQDRVYRSEQSEQMEFQAELKRGGHDILVRNGCGSEDWGFVLSCSCGDKDVCNVWLRNPGPYAAAVEK